MKIKDREMLRIYGEKVRHTECSCGSLLSIYFIFLSHPNFSLSTSVCLPLTLFCHRSYALLLKTSHWTPARSLLTFLFVVGDSIA